MKADRSRIVVGRLGLVPALSVIGVAAVTAAAYLLEPAAHAPTASAALNDPSLGLIEPADRAALVSWILLAVLLGAWFTFRPKPRAMGRPRQLAEQRTSPTVALGVLATIVTVLAVTWTTEVTGSWKGFSLGLLLTSLVAGAGLLAMPSIPPQIARVGSVLISGTVLAYAIPALVQVPSGLRDPYHYAYTSDEIVAVAAGHFPLADYIPQYTNLLGFPVAPVLHLAPARSELIVIGWLLFLQVVALGIAVSLPVLLAGRRFLAPALLVACAPPLLTLGGSLSPSTYFAVLPIRVVLPAATALVTYLALRNRPEATYRRPARFLGIGTIAGVAALNNPDYGLPVVVVVLVVAILTGNRLRSRATATVLVAAGSTLPFLAYGLVGAAAGKPVVWSNWLAFQRVFGIDGFRSVAMAPFGPHVGVVALFVAAAVLGFALLVSSRAASASFAYRQGLVLALVGGWALLTLPYFSGRSLTPTLIGGYMYTVGLVVAALLPLVHRSIRAIRARIVQDVPSASTGAALGLLAVASVVATMTFVWAPSEYIDRQVTSASGRSEPLKEIIESIQTMEDAPGNGSIRQLVESGRVAQSVNMSSLVQLTTGLPSMAIASSPTYLPVSPFFAKQQCDAPWPRGTDHLLVTRDAADALRAEPACAKEFDLDATREFSSGDVIFALLEQAPSTS